MKSDCYVPIGVPVIRGNNISDTRELVGDFVHITEQQADELRACNVVTDDLVFPHRGAIGEVAIVPADASESTRRSRSPRRQDRAANREQCLPAHRVYWSSGRPRVAWRRASNRCSRPQRNHCWANSSTLMDLPSGAGLVLVMDARATNQ
jgi:hypothetical protein